MRKEKQVRKDWYVDHMSGECVVWGHDPRPYPTMVNDTVNIDQGVVFGGMLTAWSMPEREIVSVRRSKTMPRTRIVR